MGKLMDFIQQNFLYKATKQCNQHFGMQTKSRP